MALVEWDDHYSVGNTTLDGHHQRLFDIINRLYEATRRHSDDSNIARIIGELIEYTQYHFRAEEEMMQRAGHPTLEAHKVLHRKFEDDLLSLQTTVSSGMAGLASISILNSSVRWLQDHILTVDKGYSARMAALG